MILEFMILELQMGGIRPLPVLKNPKKPGRFPTLQFSHEKMVELELEFHEFQILEETQIPKSPSNEKYLGMADRIDIAWNRIGEMTSADGAKRFKYLFPIAKLVLSLAHSNAEEERLFSLVKRNKTAFHSNPDP